ncbi:hypothetical protein I3843_03G075800 [Carya illinoinensis]|nr:hypothetical protein I3760_03G073200 [Carya illinoinensis]KAG2715371.1 hypothetical protein I3760_03G073200 [Carya illinoinensis]KAG2715372.1 hypothetical protein I3760_03G073200 [Carya illinoinensis]KAG2715373.1 hypothetical protein I3760_03G073200 [Carya illinoinensis]KAG2715378.1 hypothetical protein I3760_03G073200 [Carya illinoinensis]
METDAVCEATASVDGFETSDLEAESIRVDFLEGITSNGEIIGELGNAGEVLTRVELMLACYSEKLVNLSVLVMHVATRESDFEAFASLEEHMSGDYIGKALEFDLLSGILDSEARELDKFTATLQADVITACEIVSSFKHLGETFMEMEGKLRDAKQSLKQSQDQVSEIRTQSAKFQRILSCSIRDGNCIGDKGGDCQEDDELLNTNAKIKMQTADQQRHILRMLEKSLAREIDLEKKLTDSRQIEEELKLRLNSSEQEVFYLEEEAADVWKRCFQTDNASEVLMGVSKELLGRLQICQFSLNGAFKREAELRSKLEHSTEQLKAKETGYHKLKTSSAELNDSLLAHTNSLKVRLKEAEDKLILSSSEASTLREALSSLENQLKESKFGLLNAKVSADESQVQHNVLTSKSSEMEYVSMDPKENIVDAEYRAESAEAKCKLLEKNNIDLNEQLRLLKGSGSISEKVNLLERQLRESDIQLQYAVASAEASQEKQIMLYSAIGDMENLIKDLKLKVSTAEIRADSAEEKCILLSESNAELNEELSFLRGRLESLEASLHQAQEMKKATAKDIGIRTKVITDLVMQLAIERERLHKQLSSLAMENQILLVRLQHMNKDSSVTIGHNTGENIKEFFFPEHDLAAVSSARGSNEEISELPPSGSEWDKTSKNASIGKTKVRSADITSELETVRRIDAGLLNFKHVSIAMLILLISVVAYLFRQQNCPF